MNMEGYIYIIKNIQNGKFYLGSSIQPNKRWKRHIRDLESGTHHSIYLQRSWNKYGKDNFSFEIIKKCHKSDILLVEQNFLDGYFCNKVLYNVSPNASGGNILSEHPNLFGSN